VPADIYLNVAVSGLLTGLVYGLMALGLSVIFGVVRVVNFAHGEMMTIAMYLAVALFSAYKLDPLAMLAPIAAVLFALGYLLQRGLINPFINRPEHSQFMLLVAVALIMVNALLIAFGPDARGVQTSYAFASFALGPLIGKVIRACADNYAGALVVGLDVKRLYALTFAIGSACVGACGSMMVLLVDVTPPLGPTYTLLAFVIVITGGLGSMAGALLGGVLIGMTEALGGLLFTPSAKSMFTFAILVVVLLFRPQGLLGKRLT